jgi:hypothetical protein
MGRNSPLTRDVKRNKTVEAFEAFLPFVASDILNYTPTIMEW